MKNPDGPAQAVGDVLKQALGILNVHEKVSCLLQVHDLDSYTETFCFVEVCREREFSAGVFCRFRVDFSSCEVSICTNSPHRLI
ncbi:hypothetical protein scyTo_0011662 [Scyliorhinus torazame]|uniref:Uncharacterized protein n=1 Tax=Scyliorhinus torazame TaxID=75743 RepID=A0A401NS56_SCYTO|nr:hypothetical protein [Scyliorhinus torazame]